MTDLIRWGVLGAAKIAREHLCPAIHQSRNGTMAALATRGGDPAKAAPFLERYPGLKIHDTYEALLADPDIDAIYIPLPNGDHVEWTLKCLEAGKHVLCEKPIALKANEIDALIAARDSSGKLAAEAFMVTHHPQWLRVRELIQSGAIGALQHVQGAFSFFNDDPANVRNQKSLGGGALRDIGVYPCVTTRFVTGQEPVAIAYASIDWDKGIDATARVAAEFPDFTMDFYCSMRMALRQQMTFHGTTGFLSLTTPFNANVYGMAESVIRLNDGTQTRETFPAAAQYLLQIDAFNHSALTGAAFACPLEFSKGNQEMLDMIYAAANTA